MKSIKTTASIVLICLGLSAMSGCQGCSSGCSYDDDAMTGPEFYVASQKDKTTRSVSSQPQNPAGGQNRPPQYTYNGSGGSISFGCVVSFFSGGGWWAIGTATPADIAAIKAGTVQVMTADNRTGYVGSSTSTSNRTSSPMRTK